MENRISEIQLKELIRKRFRYRALLADILSKIKAFIVFCLSVTSTLLSAWLPNQTEIPMYVYWVLVFICMSSIISVVTPLLESKHIDKWIDRYYQKSFFYFVMLNDAPASLVPIDGFKRPKIKKNRHDDTEYIFRYPRTICYGHFHVRSPSAEIKLKQQITSWKWADGARGYLVQIDAVPITKLVPNIEIWDQLDWSKD